MVSFTRTANAGGLLQLDGVDILLDGVCGEVPPYLPTPPSALEFLKRQPADIVAFTHLHTDHYDAEFCRDYHNITDRGVMLPGSGTVQIRTVEITPVRSRHLGKTDCSHVSYIIEGSDCCIWFMGDASALQWKEHADLPKPDIVIAPFAYATTQTSWHQMQVLKPRTVILVHMPKKDADKDQIWNMVESVTDKEYDILICIPRMMEKISIAKGGGQLTREDIADKI